MIRILRVATATLLAFLFAAAVARAQEANSIPIGNWTSGFRDEDDGYSRTIFLAIGKKTAVSMTFVDRWLSKEGAYITGCPTSVKRASHILENEYVVQPHPDKKTVSFISNHQGRLSGITPSCAKIYFTGVNPSFTPEIGRAHV